MFLAILFCIYSKQNSLPGLGSVRATTGLFSEWLTSNVSIGSSVVAGAVSIGAANVISPLIRWTLLKHHSNVLRIPATTQCYLRLPSWHSGHQILPYHTRHQINTQCYLRLPTKHSDNQTLPYHTRHQITTQCYLRLSPWHSGNQTSPETTTTRAGAQVIALKNTFAGMDIKICIMCYMSSCLPACLTCQQWGKGTLLHSPGTARSSPQCPGERRRAARCCWWGSWPEPQGQPSRQRHSRTHSSLGLWKVGKFRLVDTTSMITCQWETGGEGITEGHRSKERRG